MTEIAHIGQPPKPSADDHLNPGDIIWVTDQVKFKIISRNEHREEYGVKTISKLFRVKSSDIAGYERKG